jgi:hypothetical protein
MEVRKLLHTAGKPAGPALPARKSLRALAVLGLLAAAFAATFADAAQLRARRSPGLALQAKLARRFGLTDLCLFPEARYMRHLSQADLHSAFQDHPGALDHFPSGSLAGPPASLTNSHANVD